MEIEKNILRLEIRKTFTAPLPEESSAICSRLAALPCWSTGHTILAYHPLSGEVDLLPLLAEEGSKHWIFPRIVGDSLSLHRWSPGAHWMRGPFGINEPDPDQWPEVSVETVDLALVPGLAFDPCGNRLGRGKGYYDRLLGRSGFRALKIGIVPDRLVLPGIPTEEHDIRMDLVMTDSALHIPSDLRGAGWTSV